jgi:hypothetical protein
MTGIIFIVVIVGLGLVLLLAMVARATRRPAQERPQRDQVPLAVIRLLRYLSS